MFFLNIAEKPSVAKSISYTLSSSTTKTSSPNKYTPNYKFDYKSTKMLFTSLLGHLFHHDFIGHKDWSRSDPKKLLNDADIHKLINQNQETIKQNILHNSRYADTIILWTDCDREGENIAMEVKNLILETYPNKIIKRARFNAISYSNIVNALENLVDINVNESDAVGARIELDLRLGSAFTRIQTINIKRDTVISYGPCQIPTLNFVVERMVRIEGFVPEDFYSLKLKVKKVEDVFDWVRGNVFDKNCVIHVYERLIMQKYGIIIDVNVSHKEKARPLPLRTVEMQKACSSLFKISSHQVMQIAEGLYTKGYISYPRTETDVFPKNFDFKEIINKLSNDYAYCQKMNELFTFPRHGSNNDMAHFPIYPLKSGAGLANNDKRIFDFIARRFLGCISKNAIGEETNVKIKIANEEFALKGLLIKERNYLEIYTYDTWNEKKINNYVINEKVSVQGLDISDGKTSPPELITEPELISLMDKNGIGTDATIAEHIQKIQDRAYVYKKGKYFIATNLGKGLIFGYNELGLQNFVKPYLRCELEKQLECICEGRIGMREVVRKEIEIYLHFYDIIANGIGTIKNKISECDNNHQDDDSSSSSSDKPSNKPKNARATSNKQSKYKKDDTDGKNVYKQKTDAYTKNRENQAPSNYKNNTKKQRSSIIQQNENYGSNNTENENKVAKISAIPICHCKQQAVKSIVKKDTGNKGKAYYRCSKYTDGCKFFQWAEDKLECYCNYEPQIKTSRTENNNGRQFYCCKKAHKPCKYFKWIDE